MKLNNKIKIVLMILLFKSITFAYASDGDDKYVMTMQKNIDALYSAKDVATIQGIVNSLDRIASVETTKWEPQYYIGYGYVMMAFRESESAKKDVYLDLALTAIEKGKGLLPNDSEFAALEGFAYMIRVTIDPASRGAKYSGLALQLFGRATALNPENPRALALQAQMQYGMAQFFGSPTTEACNTLNAALQKFETYKLENVLAPTWGKGMAESMKPNCQ